jgi:hypothetical protein
MKYLVLAILISFVGLMFGCSNNLDLPESYPEDFLVEYDWGSCYGMWGRNNLKINSKGETILVIEEDMILKDYYYYTFNSEEIQSIYKIIKKDFFQLNNSYSNDNIQDGSCSKLTITANKESHSVSIKNSEIDKFNRIIDKIMQVLENYHTSGFVINYEKLCNQAIIVCEENDLFEGIECGRYLEICEDRID